MQFVCGYYDVDLRDSTGLGHGRLIARHASPSLRDQWLPSLLDGAIPGIAITEPHGGSQGHATRTRATSCRDGTWTVTGMKTWISRLTEAAVFCLFFTDPDGEISVAAIDARSEGLTRTPLVPAGLSGWTWGELHLNEVRIRPDDIIGQQGSGMRLLREHFAGYRPLVAATALGAAAGCYDRTVATLESRRRLGIITRLRDNALITIGRSFAEINAALLAACNAAALAESGSPFAASWGCAVKAYGVDAAPPGRSHTGLYAGLTTRTSPSASRKNAVATVRLRASDATYRSGGSTSCPVLTLPTIAASRDACRTVGSARCRQTSAVSWHNARSTQSSGDS